MEVQGRNKVIITLVIVLLVAGVASYYLFFKPAISEVAFDEFGNPVAAQAVGQDLIDLLNELEQVTFDSSFFRSQVFSSLFDFSVILGTQPQGRVNPFEAIGR